MKSVCPKEHHNFFYFFFIFIFFLNKFCIPFLQDKKHCGHQRAMNDGISSKAFGHFFFPLCTTSQTIRLDSSNFYHYLLLHAFCLFFDTVIKYIQGFLYVKRSIKLIASSGIAQVSSVHIRLANVCAFRLSQTNFSVICSW